MSGSFVIIQTSSKNRREHGKHSGKTAVASGISTGLSTHNPGELNCAFQMCLRTIRRDITVLSCTYPITMLQGAGGGVFIAKSFRLGTRYLTDDQCRLLEKLSATLEGTELKTMQSILKKFKRPRV